LSGAAGVRLGMANLTREMAVAELAKGNSFLYGDPEKNVPFGVIDPEREGWARVVAADTVRNLIQDGVIVEDGDPDPAGKRRFRLTSPV
jgi:hypothetical protein